MTGKEWNAELTAMLASAKKVLTYKASVYATEEDRFHNFRRAAEINRLEGGAVEAAWGMATKHLVTVIDIIEGRKVVEEDQIEEVFGDLRNYLFLIEGMLKVKEY